MNIRDNQQYLLKLLFGIVGCLLMEGIIFNYPTWSTRNLEPNEINLARNVSEIENEIIIEDIETDVSTVYVSFSGSPCIMTIQAWITDEASRDKFVLCDEYMLNPGHKEKHDAVLRVESHGKLHRLKLAWNQNRTIEALELNNPVPYEFNLVRFLLMLIVCTAFMSIRYFHMYRYVFDPMDRRQLLIYTLIMLVCICFTTVVPVLITPYDLSDEFYSSVTEYPFANIKSILDKTHAVMFDSLFHKGVVQVEPSQELLELENPYDRSQRSTAKVHYLYDYAYYNGKYFSYFGLTPVLLYFLPFYLVQGYLPSYMMASHFFAMLTIIGCFACMWELAKRFASDTSALLLFAMAPTVAWGSNVLMLLSSPDRYCLSIQSMQAFFFLTLWAGFRAVGMKKRHVRSFYFILCAVFTFFLVWSKPSGSITAAGWIMPLFIFVLIDGQYTAKEKVVDVLSFMIPLCAGAIIVMNYNMIRFNSPFEFGQSHQLTGGDVHYHKVKIRDLFIALWYYYFNGFTLSSEFPWVRITKSFINYSRDIFYTDPNAGAMTVPVSWGICLLTKGLSEKNKKINIIILSALFMTVFVALTDYCLAGVVLRYVCDIQPSLCLAGALLFMIHAGEDFRAEKPLAVRAGWLLCLFTFIIAFCLVFNNNPKITSDSYLFFTNMLSIR